MQLFSFVQIWTNLISLLLFIHSTKPNKQQKSRNIQRSIEVQTYTEGKSFNQFIEIKGQTMQIRKHKSCKATITISGHTTNSLKTQKPLDQKIEGMKM